MSIDCRDTIVIGASAGGIEALKSLFSSLNTDIAAAIFVVVHTPPFRTSELPKVLSRFDHLPAVHPQDGEKIERGRIYVAPPDHHMTIEGNTVRVTRGPKENRARPAIDPLFRSASEAFGPRVVGILLSGCLDDGVVGLEIIKARGGTAVVQDPNDALFPIMPQTAVDRIKVDYVLPAPQIAVKLGELCRESMHSPASTNEGANTMALDSPEALVERDRDEQIHDQRQERSSLFGCPECGGTLWQIGGESITAFRCHTGHRYSTVSLLIDQAHATEKALYVAMRSLTDTRVLKQQVAERARKQGLSRLVDQLQGEIKMADEGVQEIKAFIEALGDAQSLTETDASALYAPDPQSSAA